MLFLLLSLLIRRNSRNYLSYYPGGCKEGEISMPSSWPVYTYETVPCFYQGCVPSRQTRVSYETRYTCVKPK